MGLSWRGDLLPAVSLPGVGWEPGRQFSVSWWEEMSVASMETAWSPRGGTGAEGRGRGWCGQQGSWSNQLQRL